MDIVIQRIGNNCASIVFEFVAPTKEQTKQKFNGVIRELAEAIDYDFEGEYVEEEEESRLYTAYSECACGKRTGVYYIMASHEHTNCCRECWSGENKPIDDMLIIKQPCRTIGYESDTDEDSETD